MSVAPDLIMLRLFECGLSDKIDTSPKGDPAGCNQITPTYLSPSTETLSVGLPVGLSCRRAHLMNTQDVSDDLTPDPRPAETPGSFTFNHHTT